MSFLNESFWLAVSFAIFLYFAYRPVKNSILKILDAKIATIKAQVLEAANLKEDAKILLQQTKEEVSKLTQLQEKMLAEATKNTKELVNERSNEIERLLNYRKQEALNSIDYQKQQACNKVQADFAEIVSKLVAEYLKSSKNESLSDTEIAKNLMNKEL